MLYQSDIISSAEFTQKEIQLILKKADEMKKGQAKAPLKGKILASCFFEPSTRTRLSFESAMLKLGGDVIGFTERDTTSAKKGETLEDAMRVIGSYADIIVIRHPLEGSARLAAEATDVPVINAGDGANQHPTQTLLDLFTMQECQKKLKGLSVAFVGDLKYGRTVHSLALACALFDMRLYFVSPESFSMPDSILQSLRHKRAKFSFHKKIQDILSKVDILYMTRLQEERLSGYEAVKKQCILTKEMLKKGKENLKVLHPLPRIREIDPDVDSSPQAYFFQQAQNGLYVRQALLTLLLKKGK